jgi:hypothetical protein
MSKLETNTIDTVSGTSTLQVGSTNTTTITLGASGDTVDVPSGATFDATGATITGITQGITLADQWHVTAAVTDIAANTDTVITNWTQDGYGEDGRIGTMSESSGIFTFPSTGIYLVELALTYYYQSAASNYNYARLQITTNNSSYNTRAETTNFTRAAENYITTSPVSIIIDVTDTSNVKVRPVAHVRNAGTDLEGGSIVRSYIKFIRLGDT